MKAVVSIKMNVIVNFISGDNILVYAQVNMIVSECVPFIFLPGTIQMWTRSRGRWWSKWACLC